MKRMLMLALALAAPATLWAGSGGRYRIHPDGMPSDPVFTLIGWLVIVLFLVNGIISADTPKKRGGYVLWLVVVTIAAVFVLNA